MSNQRNIKAAPAALTPAKVEQLLHWADHPDDANGVLLHVDPRHPRRPVMMGVDLSSKPGVAVQVTYQNGRIVTVEERKLSDD